MSANVPPNSSASCLLISYQGGVLMKRPGMPALSDDAQQALNQFEKYLREEEDLSAPTVRNYLSDLRQFMTWCEATWEEGQEEEQPFTPAAVATPAITRYRSYLQHVLELKPATINRHLISLKRYFAWAMEAGLVQRDPARVVKLVEQVDQPPRHLTDQEENGLVAAVTDAGSVRDRVLIILMLHTGLRVQEVCSLRPGDVNLGKRSGALGVYGKRNKYREVPLNVTARDALKEYLKTLPKGAPHLFCSEKTGGAMTERAIGHVVKKYAELTRVEDLSPHDLRHRFGYRMAESVPLHRLAQIMGHDSLDTTMIYIRGTRSDLQKEIEKIAWT